MAMSRDEIFEKVQEVLVDALGLDDDEVTNEATLMGDLGAESIDFLDIVFRLEKAFDIKVPREELFPAEAVLNNPEFVSNGKLTDKGLTELKDKMPHTDLTELKLKRCAGFGSINFWNLRAASTLSLLKM